jgi:ubiquinone/menaquinone biosynthesis C-methylase UbiE
MKNTKIKAKKLARYIRRISKFIEKPNNYIGGYNNNSSDIDIIVSKNKLIEYINNGNKLIDDFSKRRIQNIIEEISSIMDIRNTYYVNIESDKQFITVYKKSNTYKSKLYEMLSYLLGDILCELVIVLCRNNMNDTLILDFIKTNYKSINKQKKYRTHYNSNLIKISEKIYKYTKAHAKIPKILDVGTGNGKKINYIKKQIDCKIYGADIEEWGLYAKKRNFNFEYKIIQQEPYNIPYKNNMFDCILLSLVLHHCKNIIEVINECQRILTDEGIIVIIEHDIWLDYDQLIIDIQHRIYECLNNEPLKKEGNYMNYFQWDIIFDKCNMYPIYADRLPESINYDIRYDIQFICIYKKNKK